MDRRDERRALPDARKAREKQPIVGKLLKAFGDDDQPVARDRVAECGVRGPLRCIPSGVGAVVALGPNKMEHDNLTLSLREVVEVWCQLIQHNNLVSAPPRVQTEGEGFGDG